MGKFSRDKDRRILDWLPDYDISEDGEVRRITPAKTRGRVPYVVKGRVDQGYHSAKLVLPNGTKRDSRVHRLVCEAFHGAPERPDLHAAHWDGDRLNNNFKNLRWATVKENVGLDRHRHGRAPCGARNPRAKLTATDVAEIREQFTGRHGQIAALSREYGISYSGMWSVCHGENWKDG